MVAASLSKKRAAPTDTSESEGSSNGAKIQKVHPFFSKEQGDKEGPFRWLKPFGRKKTCLHAVHLEPKSVSKVAAFDLDGTIIKSSFAKGTAKSPPSFEWWHASVPQKLKQVHEEGFSIVIISNQAIRATELPKWKQKLALIAESLPAVPFRVFAATAKDEYRKPMLGMWHELENIFKEDGVEVIDKSTSFFVGDAAGRQYGAGRADFSSTDRKWALNIGIPFFTPEEYFLGRPSHDKYELPGFRASEMNGEYKHIAKSDATPVVVEDAAQEVVIFVGYPCLGKSTFYRKHFAPRGYTYINQDVLGTRPKCVKALREALSGGTSCAVDNTNRDAATRRHYTAVAKEMDVPVRCFVFTGSLELAWHNNLYRAYNLPPSVAATEPPREIIPYTAFTSFRSSYEEPDAEKEGFKEVRKVGWVFEGSPEEQRYWEMWLQIDGK
ncbi:polynucleotide kinase 3'-phosphatase [Fistulina hepatica ATCC 64428]|uniref:Polynucleotide kinase 3'-phosphatase n=1 Tax=Fistulina hepatica ATCC 64428 TaxID=1128425 RepID=A0A0D7A2X6_9AGAR|nr:polynucleotide kinase 3'-phosphatase [Fistulina hepatica ATCC 64428]